jgi:hypothetical protein
MARVLQKQKKGEAKSVKVATKTSVRNGRKPSPARPPGRPLTLTLEVHKKIVKVLAAGNYRRVAALAAGIEPGTLDRWLYDGMVDRDRGDDSVFSRLYKDVVEAEQKVTQKMVASLVRGGEKDPKFSVEYLQRRHPDEWGNRSRIVHEGNADAPLQTKGTLVVDISERAERFRPLLEKLASVVVAPAEGDSS